MRTRAITTCALAGALALAAAVAAQQPPSPAPAPATAPAKMPGSGSLIESEPKPDLFLLYTGDVIGYVDACG
jgi:hypothetical protein